MSLWDFEIDFTANAAKKSDDHKSEYGDVEYADPKNHKYPINSEERVRAAWSYINMPKNQKGYTSEEVAAIKSRIRSKFKKYGIQESESKGSESDIKIEFTAEGKTHTQCDHCKLSIDRSKPKPKKMPDGTSKPQLNPAIEATLEFPIDSGETKSYHFCDEECLRQYLNKRASKK